MSDPVWSWCPDCGTVARTEGDLDLTVLERLGLDAAPTAAAEPFPTEWAISA